MLTYFEIDSDSVFDMHSHESEQITMVISGEKSLSAIIQHFRALSSLQCIFKTSNIMLSIILLIIYSKVLFDKGGINTAFL